MSTAINRTVARRFVEEVLGRGDFAALDALAVPDCLDHAAAPGPAPRPAALAQFLVPWREAFPDLEIAVEDLVAEGDRVAVRWTLRGTHRGAFFGLPPSGRRVAVGGVELYRLAGGRIVERWAAVDMQGLLHQLGADPATACGRAPTPACPAALREDVDGDEGGVAMGP